MHNSRINPEKLQDGLQPIIYLPMKIATKNFNISTKSRSQMLDITADISKALGESGIENGICTIYCPHTTAGVTINENADPDVVHDILLTLEKLVPEHAGGYRHSEGNSDAHVKSSLVGQSKQILIENSKLLLGTWQAVFFCEFDGPRNRKIFVQFAGN